jgi:muramoyltetrapeptide carboxypeptidase
MSKASICGCHFSPLQPGDKVAIVAPSGVVGDYGMQSFACQLESWGLHPIIGQHVYAKNGMFAGTDRQRAEDFQWAISSPDIKAVLCARGGYGAVRILDFLDWSAFEAMPKPICGFSDITVLHATAAKLGVPSMHSYMGINASSASIEAAESLRIALMGGNISYKFETDSVNIPGKATAPIAGGNLSVMLSLRGMAEEPDWEGKIIFIEDVGETLYHLDRMMQNLRRTIFPKINGLAVGRFSDMREGRIPYGKTADQIIYEAASGFGFPVAFGFPAGHVPDNRAFWLNTEAELCVSGQFSTLSFAQGI